MVIDGQKVLLICSTINNMSDRSLTLVAFSFTNIHIYIALFNGISYIGIGVWTASHDLLPDLIRVDVLSFSPARNSRFCSSRKIVNTKFYDVKYFIFPGVKV